VKSIQAQVASTVRGILVAPGLAHGVQPLLASLNLEFKPLSPRKAFEVLKSRGLVKQHELSAWF
jgi:RecB family endonuclease NucS